MTDQEKAPTNIRTREFARIERAARGATTDPKVMAMARNIGGAEEEAAPLGRYLAIEKRAED